ncbi:MAG: hypothetical protein H8E20_05365 [Verrucomicrobia bacterium]|nr:hypothetical protein [Verrucomicrobiota bacterium]
MPKKGEEDALSQQERAVEREKTTDVPELKANKSFFNDGVLKKPQRFTLIRPAATFSLREKESSGMRLAKSRP